MKAYVYDLETYPNIFTFAGRFVGSNETQVFEISPRMNQVHEIAALLTHLQQYGATMVGFNNLGFDYPIIHELMMNPYAFTYQKAAELAHKIINAKKMNIKIPMIWARERLIPQLDLMKMCHFDNNAKRTSLKALQFAMRSPSLEDLPFDIRDLTNDEMDTLKKYNVHDIDETENFYNKCANPIKMRMDFIANGMVLGDVLNYSDVKIGGEYLTKMIGRQHCYHGRSKPRQTFREFVECKRVILPKIYFRTAPYQKVLDWFNEQTIYPTRKNPPKLNVTLAGLDFDFGVGGVHASAQNKVFYTDDSYQVVDIDVAGMYPAVAIANGFAPEHLGDRFAQNYKQLQIDRKQHAKGTSMNALLKLAANGVYGNSNNAYSCFYDPQYTFSVTINGQLQLLQLVELLSLIPGVELIQGNTDGITARVLKDNLPLFRMWCSEWEKMTGLVLEEVLYNRMWIRDVNNYMSETMDGKLKSKGAYNFPKTEKDYEGWWNKNYSNMASQIAVEKVMTHSWSPEVAIRLVTNPFDFMLRYKATGESRLYIGGVKQLKTLRYYVSTAGEPMKKVSPARGPVGSYKRANKLTDAYFNKIMSEIPEGTWDERIHTKNKSTYQIVEQAVESGWKVKQCNVASDFDWKDVDWDYYIEKTKKLIIGSK